MVVMGARALLLSLALATTARANPVDIPLAVRRALAAASVEVLPAKCAGAVAVTPWVVVTARHCVTEKDRDLRVRRQGEVRRAELVASDEVSDQVVLALDEPLPVDPLAVARRLPIEGAVLYFEGNPSRPRLQSVRLDHIARCPSLPALGNALFTTLHGAPGDSGAPLVDGAGRVVGLVHGGAQCEIATPADHLARLIDRVLERQMAAL
jgi:S1-C subfamily serine protease